MQQPNKDPHSGQCFFVTIFLARELGDYIEKSELSVPGCDDDRSHGASWGDACNFVVSVFGWVGKDDLVILPSLIWNTAMTVIKKGTKQSSHRGTAKTNPIRNYEVAGLIPGLAQWVKDPTLLWLWRTPAATAPIRPPSLGTSIFHGCSPRKDKIKNQNKKLKKKKMEKQRLFSKQKQEIWSSHCGSVG